MTPNGDQLVKDFGTKRGPVCSTPDCALMHRGLTVVEFLCTCGLWHPIADHPDAMHHNGKRSMKAKRTGAMNVTELIKSLQNAKDQDAEVILTDTEGSFSVGILTVEECGDGEVLIVAEPHPQL